MLKEFGLNDLETKFKQRTGNNSIVNLNKKRRVDDAERCDSRWNSNALRLGSNINEHNQQITLQTYPSCDQMFSYLIRIYKLKFIGKYYRQNNRN